ncbi:hypothetical protein CEXT_201801 [Caerostris extrusa]|uniref:Uncharacterized protein n=1 Tax=Caerostris extrusa TaxID=172846 RepID=A0AAV4V2C1_CAEEX|nr:hypothetical protein CEXT_201801 [Caerostris extrusa]
MNVKLKDSCQVRRINLSCRIIKKEREDSFHRGEGRGSTEETGVLVMFEALTSHFVATFLLTLKEDESLDWIVDKDI